ncbi:phosphate ABC transporter, permease protein PstA, partial [Methylophaga sp. 42_8_T64]
MSNKSFSSWMKSGSPWVWLNAGAVSISLVMVVGLLLLIAVRGLSHFWPADIMAIPYTEPGKEVITLVGEAIDSEVVSAKQLSRVGIELPEGQASAERLLIKVGNRDYFGLDFRWINQPWMGEVSYPAELLAIERREWGEFYGYLSSVKQQGEIVVSGDAAFAELQHRLIRSNNLVGDIKSLAKNEMGKINAGLEELRLEKRKLELRSVADTSIQFAELAEAEKLLDVSYKDLQNKLAALYKELNRDQM